MLLKVEQVAESLRVTRSCVYWLLGEGHLHGIRLGFGRGTIRVKQEELERYICDNTVKRRGKPVGKPPRSSAPNAFTHLNGSRLRKAWAERGVVLPAPPQSACAVSGRRGAGKP